MPNDLSRRELLKTAAAAGLLAALDGGVDSRAFAQTPAAPTGAPATRHPFRFVHLTDVHVQHERGGDDGFKAALKAVESLKPRPDFILGGGDMVFDAVEVNSERARMLFELYQKILKDNTSLPVHNSVGNHDVFGWSTKSGATPTDKGYGKAMVKDFMQWNETFHTFNHKGWQFFSLDNVQPGERDGHYPYHGFIDGPQIDWLKAELAKLPAGTPVVMCEHIPMVTATEFDHGELFKDQEWRINNAFVCGDAAQRLDLYKSYNVRLCLSGHIHERDRIEFKGPTFINDGAVCGSWWKGPHHGVKEGFGVFDCKPDGTFDYRYHEYGWVARA
jgi:predicted MPP superfamily phosphohydrolase